MTKIRSWAHGFDGKKERERSRERSREGARAWLGSGEAAHGEEENKTVPAHVTYMGRFSPLESVYSTA